jgi:transposase
MAITTIAHPTTTRITVGVDTHGDTHVAHAKDQLGRRLATLQLPTTPAGYQQLLDWATAFGQVEAFGIEGTGCYGAALARFLAACGQVVLEVNRPDRVARRRNGKSDPLDAESAARTVQAGEATAIPKAGTGTVEMIRVLRVARCTAIRARTQTINAMRALLVTAPVQVREQLRDRSATMLARAALACAAAAVTPVRLADPSDAVTLALGSLARRCLALDDEITTLDTHLDRLVTHAAPRLLERFGVGVETAGALLVAAGDNPGRLGSEAAFARLCGVAPLEASSGKTIRHRLNRGGDRQANAALYRIALVRLRWHQPTRDYVARRTAEGKSKKEIIRCLKRYLAREVFAALKEIEEQPATIT